VIPVEMERVPVVRGKYYGRYKGDADDSESELSVDDDDSGDANGSMAAALKRCRDEQDGSREQSNKVSERYLYRMIDHLLSSHDSYTMH